MTAAAADYRVRRRVKRLGLCAVKRGQSYRITDRGGRVLHTGTQTQTEAYLAGRYAEKRPSALDPRYKPPVGRAWREAIDAHLRGLAAVGQRRATLRLRRDQLTAMARGLKGRPEAVSAEQLVDWFGAQTRWAPETRKGYRSAANGFFRWLYKTGRTPMYLGDELAKVRQPPAAPRPVPDHVWRAALLAADPRTTVMLRLAAEAGLRRGEVAAVHTRDVLEGIGGAQLLVHGKGGKQRVVPLGDQLAALLREGAAGHTPGAPGEGWLFPDGLGNHIGAAYVGELVKRVLPDPFSMHCLRHRFGTRAYRGTRNLRAVQVLLGHESVATTQRYTAVDDSEVRAAMVAAIAD